MIRPNAHGRLERYGSQIILLATAWQAVCEHWRSENYLAQNKDGLTASPCATIFPARLPFSCPFGIDFRAAVSARALACAAAGEGLKRTSTECRGMRPGRVLPIVLLTALVGCSGPFIRSQSPEPEIEMPTAKLVGDFAVPYGMHPVKVESIALVTNLPGTGSDPEPGGPRDELLSEMRAYGVDHPAKVLSSGTSSLVLVRGYLRPGIQEGDHFDVEVRVPSRSGTTSLRGGWLMETRMSEMAVLKGTLHEGSVLAKAHGPLMVDPSAERKDDNHVAAGRALVLGGGRVLKSRPLALVLKPDHRSIAVSSQIGAVVNRRFHTYVGGTKKGVANPKDDQHVELIVHPRYKDNVERYMQVLRAIALKESASQQMARLGLLERQLLDPITAATAALRLEAIGKEGVSVLKAGIKSADPEVRFYAAEALAYLDDKEAAAPLAEAARDVPAFRAYALAALSAMDDFAAYEGLRGLLDLPSNETRYGAFRALWAMNEQDPLVRGERLSDQFSYHVLDTMGPPLVHVTRSYRPEVVLFGHDQRLQTPFVIEAGKDIIITGKDDRVTAARFSANEPDQKRVVSTKVDECIRAIVELGGAYPDVVQALQQAKSKGALASRFAIDAVPSGGRRYDRGSMPGSHGREADAQTDLAHGDGETDDNGDSDEAGDGVMVANPVPGLFDKGRTTLDKASPASRPAETSDEGSSEKQPRAARSWLGTIK
jgi:flagellar basal body P-ring protein FlgI